MTEEITRIEQQIFELTRELNQLRSQNDGEEVRNYSFKTLNGPVTLLDLFGQQDTLLVIHNMGQGCRYCTLWADGLNGSTSSVWTCGSFSSRRAPSLS